MEQRQNQDIDPNFPRRLSSYFYQLKLNNRRVLNNFKIISLRLPSVFLADLVLTHSNQIIEYFESSLNDSLSTLMIYFVSKFFLFLILFFCLLLFVLTSHNVIRMYNIFGLISQPFLFTYFIDSIPKDQSSIFIGTLRIPRLTTIFFIYMMTITLTVYFYYQTYYKFILDKYEIYRYYQLYNNNGEESHFLELLTNDGYKSLHNLVLQDHEVKGKVQELNKFLTDTMFLFDSEKNKPNSLRRFIIVSYCLFGFLINDFMDREERINVISLGYLCLLGYDLISNLDQMLLRLLLRIKIFARKFSNSSTSELHLRLTSEHINVKMVLKAYFLLKILIFVLHYIMHKYYYISLDQQLPKINKYNSLYIQLKEYFFNNDQVDNQENIPSYENYLYTSTWSQLVSFLDKQLRNQFQIKLTLWTEILLFLKFMILNQTSSLISLLSTTMMISYKFNLIGLFLRKLIFTEENLVNQNSEDLNNVGEVTGILFFLLSLQSSITSLSGYERIEKFYKNYSLLFIALLHYFHTSLDIKLRRLSNVAWNEQHKRLIIISLLMVFIPFILIYFSFKHFEFSTWLLSISAFNAELIVKMVVSVFLYSLYMLDRNKDLEDDNTKSDQIVTKNGTSDSMDKFDDYIYYIKVFGHVFEFLVAILLFLNSGYILLFESYGAIRAIMILLHAYFHIWCQAYYGWQAFQNRRKLVGMFNKLPQFNHDNYVKLMKEKHPDKDFETITSGYDEKLTDMCSICYDRLSKGRALMTKCDHVFHYRCIRRWLNQNQNCPMCKQNVF